MSYQEYLSYYRNQNKGARQIGFNEPDFANILRAIRFQRGYSQSGYGWWSNLLSSIKPFLRNVAVPALKNIGKEVGKGLLRSGVDIGELVLQGENLKAAAKDALKTRGSETLTNIGGVLKNQLGGRKRGRMLVSTLPSVKKPRLKRADQVYRQFLSRLRHFDVQKTKSLKKRNPERAKRKKRIKKTKRPTTPRKKTKRIKKPKKQVKRRKKQPPFPGLY